MIAKDTLSSLNFAFSILLMPNLRTCFADVSTVINLLVFTQPLLAANFVSVIFLLLIATVPSFAAGFDQSTFEKSSTISGSLPGSTGAGFIVSKPFTIAYTSLPLPITLNLRVTVTFLLFGMPFLIKSISYLPVAFTSFVSAISSPLSLTIALIDQKAPPLRESISTTSIG